MSRFPQNAELPCARLDPAAASRCKHRPCMCTISAGVSPSPQQEESQGHACCCDHIKPDTAQPQKGTSGRHTEKPGRIRDRMLGAGGQTKRHKGAIPGLCHPGQAHLWRPNKGQQCWEADGRRGGVALTRAGWLLRAGGDVYATVHVAKTHGFYLKEITPH